MPRPERVNGSVKKCDCKAEKNGSGFAAAVE